MGSLRMLSRALAAGVVAAALGLALPAPAPAWGREGHRAVARIAYARLSPRARREIGRLLRRDPGQSPAAAFELASVWADDVRRASRPETGPWHYVDIPVEARAYDAGRDCPAAAGGCVIAALERAEAVLRDRSATASAREEALKFYVHFVGDAHQPLHCATRLRTDEAGAPVLDPKTGKQRDDAGGNFFFVTFFGRAQTPYKDKEGKPTAMQLHYVWDSSLPLRRMGAAGDEASAAQIGAYAARLGARVNRGLATRLAAGGYVRWAEEGHDLAVSHAYAAPERGDLGLSYYERNAPVVDERITAAGVRLAQRLEAIFGGRAR